MLTIEELREGLTGMSDDQAKELANVIKSIDTDGNGQINYTGAQPANIRIPGGHDGEVALHEGGEALPSLQDARPGRQWEDRQERVEASPGT